jgi:hypothetical protein
VSFDDWVEGSDVAHPYSSSEGSTEDQVHSDYGVVKERKGNERVTEAQEPEQEEAAEENGTQILSKRGE